MSFFSMFFTLLQQFQLNIQGIFIKPTRERIGKTVHAFCTTLYMFALEKERTSLSLLQNNKKKQKADVVWQREMFKNVSQNTETPRVIQDSGPQNIESVNERMLLFQK